MCLFETFFHSELSCFEYAVSFWEPLLEARALSCLAHGFCLLSEAGTFCCLYEVFCYLKLATVKLHATTIHVSNLGYQSVGSLFESCAPQFFLGHRSIREVFTHQVSIKNKFNSTLARAKSSFLKFTKMRVANIFTKIEIIGKNIRWIQLLFFPNLKTSDCLFLELIEACAFWC